MLVSPLKETGFNRNGVIYVIKRMGWYSSLWRSLMREPSGDSHEPSEVRRKLENLIVDLYKALFLYQIKSVYFYYRQAGLVFLRDIAKLDNWDGNVNAILDAENSFQKYSEELATSQWSDNDHRCLNDLHKTDPRNDKIRIQDAKGGLIRDSYSWILEYGDFTQFRDDPQSRLLWIKGDPGTGKTMLLCGIIDELEKGPNSLISYFFCQATEAQLSNATNVLRGLIYLLIIQQPSLISYLRSKHDITGEKLFQGINVWVSLAEILTDMLKDPTLKDAVLVVDALDECNTDRPQLLDFIIQSSSTPSSRVKWIISSRNWPDIEDKLDSANQKVRLTLELNKDSISKAVDTYIGYKVDRLACHKKYDKETRDAVENYLTSNADGTFLWVALVCQELADPKVRKRHTLNTLKSFPPGLDSLYDRMIGHIGDSKDADLCKEVLAIASVVYRPITLDELKVLIVSLEDLNQDDLEEIIRSCGSFLTLQERVIYFVHQSAKDFLLNKASDQILPSGIAHQHHAIFSRSLEVLSETLERDVYELGTPGFPIDQVSPPDPEPLASIRYSCVFWVNHLDDSEPQARMSHKDLQDAGIVHDFLRKKYLYWLESLSLLRTMSEGVKAVYKLEALVVGCSEHILEAV
ncbi:hypothetical protein SNK04_013687 [Fusarium graminearum]